MCNDSAELWLDTIPKYDTLAMNPVEFSSALRYRYFKKMKGFFSGLRCNCKGRVPLDKCGWHVTTGCSKDGGRIKTHDEVVHAVNQCCKHAGNWTKLEERGCFYLSNPDDNKRGDISINNPSNLLCSKEKLILDVSITSPLDGASKGEGNLVPLL